MIWIGPRTDLGYDESKGLQNELEQELGLRELSQLTGIVLCDENHANLIYWNEDGYQLFDRSGKELRYFRHLAIWDITGKHLRCKMEI